MSTYGSRLAEKAHEPGKAMRWLWELSSSLVYGGQKEGWRILLIDHARSQPA
jgi:signal peptidase II